MPVPGTGKSHSLLKIDSYGVLFFFVRLSPSGHILASLSCPLFLYLFQGKNGINYFDLSCRIINFATDKG